ncbi:MAG: dihydrofolate reductase [Alphaproteobacteria bacterium]|nr:dihydrofolate reductase [Alphaproteobacteria bacterium]
MIKLIAIVEKNLGIAENGKIPWEFEEDRKFFREKTLNSIVIMGRKTFESIPNAPLKNRKNCVITKKNIQNDVECFRTLEEAVQKYPSCWIIGGAQLYNYALEKNVVQYMLITHVNAEYNPDIFLNRNHLSKFSKTILKKADNYTICEYQRLK